MNEICIHTIIDNIYLFKNSVDQGPLPVLKFLSGVGLLAAVPPRTVPALLTPSQLLRLTSCKTFRELYHLHNFMVVSDYECDSHLVSVLRVSGTLQPSEPACVVEWRCTAVALLTHVCW